MVRYIDKRIKITYGKNPEIENIVLSGHTLSDALNDFNTVSLCYAIIDTPHSRQFMTNLSKCNTHIDTNRYAFDWNMYPTYGHDEYLELKQYMNDTICILQDMPIQYTISDEMKLDLSSTDTEIDKLNALHLMFETVSVELRKIDLFAFKAAYPYLETINQLVHTIEHGIQRDTSLFNVIRVEGNHMHRTLLTDAEYETFDATKQGGDLVIDYGTVGKDMTAAWSSNDTDLIITQELKQQEYNHAMFATYLGPTELNENNLAYQYKWCEENNVAMYYPDYKDPKYRPGRMRIGRLVDITWENALELLLDCNCICGIEIIDGPKMINENNKDVICAAPWMHLYIEPTGKARPCCTHDLEYGDTTISSIADIWNGDPIKKFRKELIDGTNQDGCKWCYEQEKYTGYSLRTGLNNQYGHMISNDPTPLLQIKYLDVRSSNLCNMACIMCGASYSSAWHADEMSLNLNTTNQSKFINISEKTENDIIDSVISDELDLIYFAGGEPLITPYHYELLEKLISMGISNNVNLRYNTNLSTLKYKSVDLIERWSHFKTVEVSASIDMIGKRAELHRYGTDWKTISKNLKTVQFDMPNVSLRPQITVTALSIGYLPELLTYLIDDLELTGDHDIRFNMALWPDKLNPQLLTKYIKELYTNKLQSFLKNTDTKKISESVITIITTSLAQMNEVDKSENFNDMIDYLNKLDEIRSTNWKELWPEIANQVPINKINLRQVYE
tara:strand:- start:740 stop:2929 length:2190 start_codon:yes stop_codon:yes gene_type:complete